MFVVAQEIFITQFLHIYSPVWGGRVLSIFCPPPTNTDHYNLSEKYWAWETRLYWKIIQKFVVEKYNRTFHSKLLKPDLQPKLYLFCPRYFRNLQLNQFFDYFYKTKEIGATKNDDFSFLMNIMITASSMYQTFIITCYTKRLKIAPHPANSPSHHVPFPSLVQLRGSRAIQERKL